MNDDTVYISLMYSSPLAIEVRSTINIKFKCNMESPCSIKITFLLFAHVHVYVGIPRPCGEMKGYKMKVCSLILA